MSENKSQTYDRFTVSRRVEHLLLILSFTTLALTGLPQKYPLSGISQAVVAILGGIETIRIIHRVSATIFILESVIHLVIAGFQLFVLRQEASMLPVIKDGKDAIQSFLHNLGIAKEAPKMGRYNFVEKLEYWAMAWGLILMGLTGFMLWNPIATARLLPGQFIPAAKVAHGYEAVLAVLAILLWHFYSVHIRQWNWSMIKGKMTREQMEEEHALELEKIEAGVRHVPPAAEVRRKRAMIYGPIAAVLLLVSFYFLYVFITFEQSAITTVPPVEENIPVYSPATPSPIPQSTETSTPEAAPAAESSTSTSATTWENGIGSLFEQKCGSCHGESGGLSVQTLAALLNGGAKGPVIVPGNAAGSALVQLQEGGTHPGLFTAEELAQIKAWIDAGALEK